METKRLETPPDLVVPPQVPLSWTLRGVRARQITSAEEGAPKAVADRAWLAAGAVIALAFLMLVGVRYATEGYIKAEIKQKLTGYSMLSDRINAACSRRGYDLVDFATTGNPVQVTCIERNPGKDGYFDSYVTAVPR